MGMLFDFVLLTKKKSKQWKQENFQSKDFGFESQVLNLEMLPGCLTFAIVFLELWFSFPLMEAQDSNYIFVLEP